MLLLLLLESAHLKGVIWCLRIKMIEGDKFFWWLEKVADILHLKKKIQLLDRGNPYEPKSDKNGTVMLSGPI